jgi:hypothetical protein
MTQSEDPGRKPGPQFHPVLDVHLNLYEQQLVLVPQNPMLSISDRLLPGADGPSAHHPIRAGQLDGGTRTTADWLNYMRKRPTDHIPRWGLQHPNSPLALIQKSDPKTKQEAIYIQQPYTTLHRDPGEGRVPEGGDGAGAARQDRGAAASVMKKLNK